MCGCIYNIMKYPRDSVGHAWVILQGKIIILNIPRITMTITHAQKYKGELVQKYNYAMLL